ncbi:MAG: NAD(P)/FAD-dependent oxidoreductase [Ilumatobacteraceae bacterium]
MTSRPEHHRHAVHQSVDVVVVGARCAGAATAMLLAERGLDVVMVDRATFPSDTLSTHAIARSGVVQLHRWGLLGSVLDSGAPAIRRVAFHTADGTMERTIKDRHGVDLLVAPRRHVLDPILQEAAVARGARLAPGVTVDSVCTSGGRATGIVGRRASGERMRIDARFVVGADGLRSRVAREVGAPLTDQRPSSGATHYAYFEGDWPAMEYFLGDGAFAGIFPTHAGQACIWVCSTDEWALARRRHHAHLDLAFDAMVRDAAPALAARLADASRRSATHGVMRMPNQIRRAAGPGWALVGDAGYHRDAITGHGISDAFRDADLLAEAIGDVLVGGVDEAGALAEYERLRDEMLREIFDITCELSAFPAADRFAELQKQLSEAIDNQSAQLADRGAPHTVGAA